jgi:glycyl-tRNA synthetase (class II)
VTVRDRDTTRQERVASGDLTAFIGEKLGTRQSA